MIILQQNATFATNASNELWIPVARYRHQEIFSPSVFHIWYMFSNIPDSKDHGANMGPTWVMSSPGEPHVGPMNLAIRDISTIYADNFIYAGTLYYKPLCEDICLSNRFCCIFNLRNPPKWGNKTAFNGLHYKHHLSHPLIFSFEDIRHWSGSSLVYLTACCMFGATPLSILMITSHISCSQNRFHWKQISKLTIFLFTNLPTKFNNGSHVWIPNTI